MPTSGAASTTTNHDEIRRWVEARGGTPARVRRTGKDEDPGVLRIDFPGFRGKDSLEHIDWDEWLRAFDDNGLAFLYQDHTATGRQSRFNKLVRRDGGQGREASEGHDGREASGPEPGDRPQRRARRGSQKTNASRRRRTATPRRRKRR